MSKAITDYPKDLHRILTRYSALMGSSESEYKKSRPDAGENEFRERFFEPAEKFARQIPEVSSLLGPSGLEAIAKFVAQDQEQLESDVAFVHMACVYSVAAMVALEHENKDLAWDLLCEAGFRLGMAMITDRGKTVFTETVVSVFKTAMATEALAKRHEKTNELKNRAYAIMRAQAPWESQAKAAYTVELAIKSEFGQKCLKNFEDTITGWIKAMPDRLELIPSLRKRLKKAD